MLFFVCLLLFFVVVLLFVCFLGGSNSPFHALLLLL